MLILFPVLISSCFLSNDDKPEFIGSHINGGEEYTKVDKTKLGRILERVCLGEAYEFIDFYPELDTIVESSQERLFLVGLLEEKGFKVVNSGRGNWISGPRIVSFTLTNEECDCIVDKLYYTTSFKEKLEVRERIKCDDRSGFKRTEINLTKNEIDSITIRLDKLVERKELERYFHPFMSHCGGAVYGYYLDSLLLMIDAKYKAELGYLSRKIYWNDNKVIKILYREHIAEWGKYQDKYSEEEYREELDKMTYTDTIYEIIFGGEYFMKKLVDNELITIKSDSNFIANQLDCGFEMKRQLEKEKELEKK